jgi:hypothetical protein
MSERIFAVDRVLGPVLNETTSETAQAISLIESKSEEVASQMFDSKVIVSLTKPTSVATH